MSQYYNLTQRLRDAEEIYFENETLCDFVSLCLEMFNVLRHLLKKERAYLAEGGHGLVLYKNLNILNEILYLIKISVNKRKCLII